MRIFSCFKSLFRKNKVILIEYWYVFFSFFDDDVNSHDICQIVASRFAFRIEIIWMTRQYEDWLEKCRESLRSECIKSKNYHWTLNHAFEQFHSDFADLLQLNLWRSCEMKNCAQIARISLNLHSKYVQLSDFIVSFWFR